MPVTATAIPASDAVRTVRESPVESLSAISTGTTMRAPISRTPTTRIAIGSQEYRSLRAGEMDLQAAFLTGKLTLEGDVEAAMKLAMAFMAPA